MGAQHPNENSFSLRNGFDELATIDLLGVEKGKA